MLTLHQANRMDLASFVVADDEEFQRIQPKPIHMDTIQCLACGSLMSRQIRQIGHEQSWKRNPRRTPYENPKCTNRRKVHVCRELEFGSALRRAHRARVCRF